MNCYKCDSLKDLSIKYKTKLGEPRYICKTCRNKDYHRKEKHKRVRKDIEELNRIRWAIQWDMLAQEINNRVMLKWSHDRLQN